MATSWWLARSGLGTVHAMFFQVMSPGHFLDCLDFFFFRLFIFTATEFPYRYLVGILALPNTEILRNRMLAERNTEILDTG